MKVLIGCEYSGTIRDAYIKRGHDAISCDLLPTESPGPHYQGDIKDIINKNWDLLIVHPPCTHLALCGAKHFEKKRKDGTQKEALEFVKYLLTIKHIPHICLENPMSIISTHVRKPDQIIQPWQFGHGETKATCLWLKNLPPLKPTKILYGKENRQDKIHQLWRTTPNEQLGHLRSKTYQGIADAMAEQWGENILTHQERTLGL